MVPGEGRDHRTWARAGLCASENSEDACILNEEASQTVLTQKSVRVFVCTALPRTSRVAEVDLHVRGDREVFVIRQLHAAVPGERLA